MPSVLVVDDEQDVRGVLSAWVHSLGYEVTEADSAAAALDTLATTPADVALCDIHLPGEDGFWLASRIRERYPSTAIIMATGAHDIDTAVTGLRNDIVDYLLKPFDRTRLIEALRLGVDWHRASKANEELQESLSHRLRNRRADVAAALAGAQTNVELAIEGLISLLELHEHDGREHAMRVSRLAGALHDQLGAERDALIDTERGALLHDIGKIDMPLSILYKPAPLDDAEWEIMRTHPQVGHDLLMKIPALAGAARIVLASHEAFNGTGYPRKLKGEDIPLGSRILAVADSYDSMTRPHTQRPAMLPAHAIQEIERCSGTQFDPRIAAALGDVLCSLAAEDERFASAHKPFSIP
jgi:response regulator RpfG family c-di-GMP phosphodiesterase